MFDGLLGRGFAPKGKPLIKLTKNRIDVLQRKRTATIKFLKIDLADLLINGHDRNAFSRAGGLLDELRYLWSLDFVEQTCALTGAVTTSLDVIKTRLMVQPNNIQGIFDCVQTIVREEGAPALLKGIGPRVLWIGIGGSIFFGVLESTKRTLAQRRPNTVKETKEE